MNVPPLFDRSQRGTFARLVANGLAQAAITVAAALVIRRLFDDYVAAEVPGRGADLLPLGIALASLAILGGVARVLQRVDAERLGQETALRLRLALFEHLCAVPARVLHSRSRGGVLLRFTNDLGALRLWVSLGVGRLTVAGVIAVATVGALFWINTALAATVAVVLAAGAAAAFLLGRPLQEAVVVGRRRRTYLANNVTEKVTALASVQVHGQTERERRRLHRQSERLRDAMLVRARVSGGVRGVAEGTTAFATGAMVLVGAQQVAAGHATPGTVVAAVTIVGVLVPQIRALGRVYECWHASRVALEKIEEFFGLPRVVADAPSAAPLERGPGQIVFDHARFEGALADVTAAAEPGQRIAVVGPNGAGKSTLLALAARLIEPDAGAVLLDGQDLSDATLASLHRAIGFVGPDAPLLRGSILRNLRYRQPRASEEEILRVSRLCGVDDVVAELPRGAETRLSEGGKNLSVGQRQRIALARALLGRPRVLLVDEVDANLEPGARSALDRALARFPGTVLMVTHQLERVRGADAVWHLDQGRLVESGDPASLLEGDGPTAELFRRVKAVAS